MLILIFQPKSFKKQHLRDFDQNLWISIKVLEILTKIFDHHPCFVSFDYPLSNISFDYPLKKSLKLIVQSVQNGVYPHTPCCAFRYATIRPQCYAFMWSFDRRMTLNLCTLLLRQLSGNVLTQSSVVGLDGS